MPILGHQTLGNGVQLASLNRAFGANNTLPTPLPLTKASLFSAVRFPLLSFRIPLIEFLLHHASYASTSMLQNISRDQ